MAVRQTFDITVPEDAWEEAGVEYDPRARLRIGPQRIAIAGTPMHLEAFAVDDDCDAVDGEFQEEVDAILTLRQNDRPDTTTIRGRDYVIVAYPVG